VPGVLWVALVEKAYAALHGSFSAIESGRIEDALCDCTAGIQIQFPELDDAPSKREPLWRELRTLAGSASYLLGASSRRTVGGGGDDHTSARGIVHGHAYAVLQVVQTSDGLRLLQLRNPWGKTEWTGKWSDADLARAENARVREQIGHTGAADDGIFWLGFDDFCEEFRGLAVCMLPTDMDCDGDMGSEWRGKTAGGCANEDSVADNPQFRLTISRPTEVVLTLTQQDFRVGATEGATRKGHTAIGMYVLYGASLDAARSRSDFHRYRVMSTEPFSYVREATLKLKLDMKGHGSSTSYLIVPCTFDAHEERGFTLRAFTQKGKPSVTLAAAANCLSAALPERSIGGHLTKQQV